ncbi:hypothetical protein K440DRAFT_665034 [Wilcoxina mikolae CBS 423.85]|nr:hypothetical protein K440DRAFT_665034 [Wilcoxina mikolae CBS 423.85]
MYLFILVLIPSLLYILLNHRRKQSKTTITSLPQIRSLLSHNLTTHDRITALTTSLTARAIPNYRLILAFGINNSFTTISPPHHKRFKTRVEKLLRLDPASWKIISFVARSLVPSQPNSGSLHLAPFLRKYVLTIIIHLFFPAYQNIGVETSNSIAELGDLINDLWIQSKHGEPSRDDQRRLSETINVLFPGIDENPLNLLLPAYETLWRVVLRCFLEVQFRGGRKVWRDVLRRYLDNPGSEEFVAVLEGEGDGDGDGVVSVKAIVAETLRLYPPTKRVYRAVTPTEVVAADIEAVHCDPELWGEDAGCFKPERWSEGVDEVRCGFMPFGEGAFVCPAKKVFAPRLIGILVAAVLEGVPVDAGWVAEKKEDEIVMEGRLGNERNEFGTLVLKWGEEN